MRANLDGSQIETLVETGRGDADRRDQTRWCVGITIDPEAQANLLDAKRPGQRRTGPDLCAPGSKSPRVRPPPNRSDIEVFFDRLPEPIDLELDRKNRVLYWTDRGDPPRGNTVNRASIDAKPQAPEIVMTHLMEGIGIALDVPGNRMFVTDFAGSVYSAKLDGSGRAQLPLRAGQSHRHRLRGNLKSDRRRTNHVQQQAYSPHRHHRNRRHRRELDGAVPGEGTGRRRDRYCAGCRDVAETLREGGLAGARAIGPRARRIAIDVSRSRQICRQLFEPRTSSRKTGPSGSTSSRSSIGSSTSCWRPT